MPIEDRVTALEQSLEETRQEFNHTMATMNRVVASQELNIREMRHDISEIQKNMTILLGIASGQEHELSGLREQGTRQEHERRGLREQGTRLEQRLDTIIALLTPKQP